MDFGSEGDCPFDTLGGGEEHAGTDEGHQHAPAWHEVPQQNSAPQPSVEQPEKPFDEAFVSLAEQCHQYPAPLQRDSTSEATQKPGLENPFAAVDSGDFVLSEAGSLNFEQPPPSVFQPALQGPAGVLHSQHETPAPPPTLPPQPPALQPEHIAQAAAAATQQKVVPAKVQPRVLEHNPFASAAVSDPFATLGGQSEEDPFSAVSAGPQQCDPAPAYPRYQTLPVDVVQNAAKASGSFTTPPQLPSFSQVQPSHMFMMPQQKLAPTEPRSSSVASSSCTYSPLHPQTPYAPAASVPEVGNNTQPPTLPPLPTFFPTAPQLQHGGAHGAPLLPPLPAISAQHLRLVSNTSTSSAPQLNSPVFHPAAQSQSSFPDATSGNARHASPAAEQLYQASGQGHPAVVANSSISPSHAPEQQQHYQGFGVQQAPPNQPQPQRPVEVNHSYGFDPRLQQQHHQTASSATPFHVQQQTMQHAPRSDSAPAFSSNQRHAATVPSHTQDFGAGMPPRAESQHFYPATHFNSADSASTARFTPASYQQQPPQPYANYNTPFVPQQQPEPASGHWSQSSFAGANSAGEMRHQGGSGAYSIGSADASAEDRFAARRRGALVCFGFGGRVFVGKHSHKGVRTSIHSTTVQEVLTGPSGSPSGREYATTAAALPGCLSPAVKIDTVMKAFSTLASCVSPVLLAVLQAMCTKQMDWSKGGQQELLNVLQQHTPSSTAPVYLDSAPQPWGQQEALHTIQRLLMSGQRLEAVRCAMHYKLHSHALLIAMMCDTKDIYQNVVSSIIKEQLDARSPLAFAYCAFNELPPPEVPAEERAQMLQQWVSHVAMLLANFTRESGEMLLQIGDQLTEAGQYDAAHVCYLVAQLSPASRPAPQAGEKAAQVAEALRSRYLLLGGHYHRSRCRSALILPHTIFLTEVLEYSRQRENEKFVRAQLIPFRVAMAELYCELGLMQHCDSYLTLLSKLLPTQTARKDDHVTRSVAEVLDSIRKRHQTSQQMAQAGANSGKQGRWWPFSSKDKAAAAAAASSAGGKSLTTPSTGAPIARASSANPVVSGRVSTSPPPQNPTAQQPETTKRQEPSPDEPDPKKPDPKSASGSAWSITGLFRRGGSQTQVKKTEAKDEPKPMIIDTDEPPTFDHATGRWLFKRSHEEEAVERQIQAGPPKLPVPVAGLGPFGAPPLAGTPLYPQQQAMGGPPPLPGALAGGPPTQRKYVDMFNS